MGKLINNLARWYFSGFPVEKGKWKIWVKVRPFLKMNGAERVQTTTNFGFRMNLDLSEHIDKFIYYWGCWEPNETWVMEKILRPGDTYVDIGAHIGYHSLLGAHFVGDTGEVIAFEPVPSSAEVFRKNLELNSYKNIVLHENAVSNQPGIVKIGKPSGTGSQNNTMRVDGDTSEFWEVAAKRLDDVLPADKPLRFIKIDVEGAELLVLKGFEKHLKAANPPFVLLEMNDKWIRQLGGSSEELYNYMTSFGYKAYDCENLKFTPITFDDIPKDDLMDVMYSKEDL